MRILFKITTLFLVLVNLSLFALQSSKATQKERMQADLDFIKRIFQDGYAPAEWKNELFGWNLEEQYQSALAELQYIPGKNIKAFQRLVMKFCKSTKDYHVASIFSSTEYAFLPFDIKYRNGKYILIAVYGKNNPLAVGDELILLNNQPIETALIELQKSLGEENKKATDRELALEILTTRNAKLGHKVPRTFVEIQIRKRDTNQINVYEVDWFYGREQISNPFLDFVDLKKNNREYSLFDERLNLKSSVPYYDEMKEIFAKKDHPADLLGSRKSVFSSFEDEQIDPREDEQIDTSVVKQEATENLSSLFEWLWPSPQPALPKPTSPKTLCKKSQEYFDAKLVKLPSGKKAGFVRISTYGEEEPEDALKAFISCIGYFQSEADLLIIDQTNNPGGSVMYMYALASLLTDRPLMNMKDRQILTQTNVLTSIEMIAKWEKIDFSRVKNEKILSFSFAEIFPNLLKEHHHRVNQWNAGHLLSDPFPLFGMEFINPHPEVNFTKPIFVMVNEKSLSCGDYFPALLQDNKRATIIGTPTAGAGGTVETMSFNNLNGINKLRYSTSFSFRLDGTSLENIGVTPDIYFDFNNELFDKDCVTPDFHKLYKIIDQLIN